MNATQLKQRSLEIKDHAYTSNRRWMMKFFFEDFSGGTFYFDTDKEMLEFAKRDDIKVDKMFHLVEIDSEQNSSANNNSLLKVCPCCGQVIGFSSHFGGYVCNNCGFEELLNKNKNVLANKQVNVNVITRNEFGVEKTETVKVCASREEAEYYVESHEQEFADNPDIYEVEIETVNSNIK